MANTDQLEALATKIEATKSKRQRLETHRIENAAAITSVNASLAEMETQYIDLQAELKKQEEEAAKEKEKLEETPE